MFLAAITFCGHNLRNWWEWVPDMTVQRLETRLSLLLNLDGQAAETLTAVQSGKSRLPDHRMQQLQVLLYAMYHFCTSLNRSLQSCNWARCS